MRRLKRKRRIEDNYRGATDSLFPAAEFPRLFDRKPLVRNATIVTRIGKDRTPSLAKYNANRAITSSICIYIYIYLLASEASLSLVMSIELEIY